MIWISLLSFFLAGAFALVVVRQFTEHSSSYADGLPQRFHVGHVPRVGGLALLLGTCGGWLGGMIESQYGGDPGGLRIGFWILLWTASLLPAVLGGVAEDMTQRLTVRYRLLLTLISAAAAVTVAGLRITRVDIPVLDLMLINMPWLAIALALLAVSGLPHAFNIIDGYNGLAGMVAFIVCLALAHVALQVGDRQLAAVIVCVAGATAGFLLWNYPRGMLFAGDGGAYLWGLTIAMVSVLLVQRHAAVSPWFPMLLLIYPVMETLFSIYRKMSRGVSPGVADALHFHQLIYRRIVRGVFHDDEARRTLMRNNRTSPYLWGFTMLTVAPAVLFWRNSWALMMFCGLFVLSYVAAYLMIIRFKVPGWLRR